MLLRFLVPILGTFALCSACQTPQTDDTVSPDINSSVLDQALSDLVDSESAAGASLLIYQSGEEIYFNAVGASDREADRPWQRDTLVSLYSMTKPVTAVTLMTLYEEGLFDLDAPLSYYLPEYSDVKVFAGLDADGAPILEVPRNPIKVIDIFRHTACFGYGWESTPVATMMVEANVLDPSKPLSQFSEELADVPLYCHPGEQWKYGVSADVQARLAEVVTARPYEELIHERVLDPLNMSETRYFVPANEKARVAAGYARNEANELTRQPDQAVYGLWPAKPVQINGGHGLIGTADDYMRFAQMLQNEGTLDGVQILKPETLALMSRDHLPDDLTAKDFLPFKGQIGYGLGMAVRVNPPKDETEPFGVTGEFFWDGAASTLFWVDPENDLTVVFLTQVMPFDGAAHAKIRKAVYQSLGMLTD